jgi:hypothetical protein
MSRIVDKIEALEFRMPMYKVMGGISSKTEIDIKKYILNNGTGNIKQITNDIQKVLQALVTDIQIEYQEVDFNIDYNNTQKILDTNSRFIINVSPISNSDITIDGRTYPIVKNRVIFINHRYPYTISQNGNSKTMLLTGMFNWDVDKHAD